MKTEVTEEKLGGETIYSIRLIVSEGQYRELERWIDRVPAIKQSQWPFAPTLLYAEFL
ncbi:MAG: hypothetical protein HYV68_00910 [Candidatus Taylorbacteria bacterium]|nr:hypothetical protein [Candidatus Taylorbacteria bacterium]